MVDNVAAAHERFSQIRVSCCIDVVEAREKDDRRVLGEERLSPYSTNRSCGGTRDPYDIGISDVPGSNKGAIGTSIGEQARGRGRERGGLA